MLKKCFYGLKDMFQTYYIYVTRSKRLALINNIPARKYVLILLHKATDFHNINELRDEGYVNISIFRMDFLNNKPCNIDETN